MLNDRSFLGFCKRFVCSSLGTFVFHQSEGKLCANTQLAVNIAFAGGPVEDAFRFHNAALCFKSIAGENRMLEADFFPIPQKTA